MFSKSKIGGDMFVFEILQSSLNILNVSLSCSSRSLSSSCSGVRSGFSSNSRNIVVCVMVYCGTIERKVAPIVETNVSPVFFIQYTVVSMQQSVVVFSNKKRIMLFHY